MDKLAQENQDYKDGIFVESQNRDDQAEHYTSQINKYTGDIIVEQKKKLDLEKEIRDLNRKMQGIETGFEKDIEEQKVKFKDRIKDMEQKLEEQMVKKEEMNLFEHNRPKMEEEVKTLKTELQREKELRKAEVAEKEREKTQATEKLRRDMLYKIKETKTELLSLNETQLKDTTKLTIQQNHQLTSELEFQSKQTETLLYKNNKMGEQIVSLKKDIEIHKQVENELAKRSHFCQKVIAKLNAKMKEHKEEIANIKKQKEPSSKTKAQMVSEQQKKSNEELIKFLQSKIDEIEKNHITTQKEYEVLQTDYQQLKEKYRRMAFLLRDYLNYILNMSADVIQQTNQDMHLNLENIKEKPINELKPSDRIALVLVLLKQLQPFLSDSRPGQDAADVLASEENTEVLNQILNSLNVQTKRSEMGSRGSEMREVRDELPPI